MDKGLEKSKKIQVKIKGNKRSGEKKTVLSGKIKLKQEIHH